MSTLEANLELLSTIPEEHQKEIQQFLLMNFCNENPYKLAQSRACYERGEGEDFDKAVDEIGAKYGL